MVHTPFPSEASKLISLDTPELTQVRAFIWPALGHGTTKAPREKDVILDAKSRRVYLWDKDYLSLAPKQRVYNPSQKHIRASSADQSSKETNRVAPTAGAKAVAEQARGTQSTEEEGTKEELNKRIAHWYITSLVSSCHISQG